MIGLIFWSCVGVILYTYAGYPALLALLARTRPKPAFPAAPEPTVTLLIAAYNEEVCIARKLENALSADYPADKLQILVAADGSDDRTVEIVRSFASRGVELSYQPVREGKLRAVDRAMALARGEIVVFSDANNMYEPGMLKILVEPFADPQVGGVSGAKYIRKGESNLGESEGLYWKYESFIKQQETRLGSCTGVSGEALAIRRSLYEPAPKRIINDDFYIAMRLIQRGYRVIFCPRARSFEHSSLSAQDEITRRARINAGRYQVLGMAPQVLPLRRPMILWQVVSHKFLRLAIPFAMIGALLVNLAAVILPSKSRSPLLALASPFNWIFLALQGLFYAAAWMGNRAPAKGKVGKLLYLPTFLVNSNAAVLQGFMGYLQKSQTPVWKKVPRAAEEGESHA